MEKTLHTIDGKSTVEDIEIISKDFFLEKNLNLDRYKSKRDFLCDVLKPILTSSGRISIKDTDDFLNVFDWLDSLDTSPSALDVYLTVREDLYDMPSKPIKLLSDVELAERSGYKVEKVVKQEWDADYLFEKCRSHYYEPQIKILNANKSIFNKFIIADTVDRRGIEQCLDLYKVTSVLEDAATIAEIINKTACKVYSISYPIYELVNNRSSYSIFEQLNSIFNRNDKISEYCRKSFDNLTAIENSLVDLAINKAIPDVVIEKLLPMSYETKRFTARVLTDLGEQELLKLVKDMKLINAVDIVAKREQNVHINRGSGQSDIWKHYAETPDKDSYLALLSSLRSLNVSSSLLANREVIIDRHYYGYTEKELEGISREDLLKYYPNPFNALLPIKFEYSNQSRLLKLLDVSYASIIEKLFVNDDMLKVIEYQVAHGYDCKKLLSGTVRYSDQGFYELYKATKHNPKVDLSKYVVDGLSMDNNMIRNLIVADIRNIPLKYLQVTGEGFICDRVLEILSKGYDTSALLGFSDSEIRVLHDCLNYSIPLENIKKGNILNNKELLNKIEESKGKKGLFSDCRYDDVSKVDFSNLKHIFESKIAVNSNDNLEHYIIYIKNITPKSIWNSCQGDTDFVRVIELICLFKGENPSRNNYSLVENIMEYIKRKTPSSLWKSIDGETDVEKINNLTKV